MSIKNQKTLFISASVILSLTALSLVLINIVIEKISHIPEPQISLRRAMDPGLLPPGMDDAILKRKPPGLLPPKDGGPAVGNQLNGGARGNFRALPNESVRRVRNGKDAPDIRRAPPPNMNGQAPSSNDSYKPRLEASPSMPSYPPPPHGMNEEERRMMEEEMLRQQQMQYPPPPGYYAPPMPDDYYDNGYDGGDYYDYDYDNYYEDYEGKNNSKGSNSSTAAMDPDMDDTYDDPEYDFEDDYMNDEFED